MWYSQCSDHFKGMQMKKLAAVVVPALLVAATTAAHAQSISPGWTAYRAKQTGQATPAAAPAQGSDVAAPGAVPASVGAPTSSAAQPVIYARRKPAPKGAFFVGVQGGNGQVYEEKKQTASAVSAGYRWAAGDFSQVGVELGAGRLRETRWQGYVVPEAKFANVGANARFQFGRDSAWFGIARAGVLHTESNFGDGYTESTNGAYYGVGLGVDMGRHFNMQLMYTGYLYANDYTYGRDGDKVHRADLFTLGAEVRF